MQGQSHIISCIPISSLVVSTEQCSLNAEVETRRSVFGTLLAVLFIQGFLIEGLRFIGDWRSLLFGALIVVAMNLRPTGLLGERMIYFKDLFGRKAQASNLGKEID